MINKTNLLQSVQVIILVALDPLFDPGDVHWTLDDLVVVRQLLPAGELVEGLGQDPAVGVLVLYHHLNQLLHLLHQTLPSFLFLLLRLVFVIVVPPLLLPLAAALLRCVVAAVTAVRFTAAGLLLGADSLTKD